MPEAVDVGISDDTYENYYVCVMFKDKTIHSLYEIKNDLVIEELFDLCLFIKED